MLNQPPQRPTFWEWIAASEEARAEYDLALVNYLTRATTPGWFQMLADMAMFYQCYNAEGHQDPNWRKGGYGC